MARVSSNMDAEQVSGFSGRGFGGTVTVNSKTYAIGMVWDTVADKGKGAAQQSREGARTHAGDLVCLRKPAKAQYGVGSKSVGHKVGMAPLASFLAECIEGSFVAIFEFPAGYYLAAARDDQVLAGCDRLIGDKQEAMEIFAELAYGSTWAQSIAPKEWGVDGTASNTIEEIIAGFKPKSTLEPASLKGKFLKIGIVLSILLVGYIGWQQYEAYQQEQAFQAEQAARAAKIAADRAEAEKNKAPVIPLPWTGKREGIFLLEECNNEILKAKTDIPGWTPIAVSCSDNRVQMGLKRNGGTLNWVGALINTPDFHPSITQTASDAVVVSWPIATGPIYQENTLTIPRDRVRKYLTSQFEEMFQPIEIKLEDPRPIPVKTARGVTNVPAPYQGLNFTIKTRLEPKEFIKVLKPIPAMIIRSVRLDISTWSWQIEGDIYEKLEPVVTTNNNSSKQ